jgi:oxygen-independent coproporphyrinogen-3 oxidase
MADFYESACTQLAAKGYEHYEISNWALPGLRSRHNLKYWRREPYIGFGAGAHSFDGPTRWANLHDSARYVACIEQGISPREQIEGVTPGQALEEEFFLGLRQLEGIDLARIEREYDAELPGRVSDLRNRIAHLQSQGLIELNGTRMRLSPARLSVSNEVLVELLG